MSPSLSPRTLLDNETENDLIFKWWGDFYRLSNKSSRHLPGIDESVILQNLKVIVLLGIGCVGAIIIGCLLFCMLYKNERILQTIPGTKEFKRRKKEPESFYPIPYPGTIRANQDKTLTLFANPKLRGDGFGKASSLKSALLKPAIPGIYASKENIESSGEGVRKQPKEKEVNKRMENSKSQNNDEDNDVFISDGSSLHESDGLDEYYEPNNTFLAGGEKKAKKHGKMKKLEVKRVRRLRKKNKYNTTIVTKGK